MIALPVFTKNKLTVETEPNYMDYIVVIIAIVKVVTRIINKPFSTFSYGQSAVDMYHVANRVSGNAAKIANKVSAILGNITIAKSQFKF